jgi:2-oxoglutarate dehydrogenase E2 component (dihydrolipoamide succinyltransferase)
VSCACVEAGDYVEADEVVAVIETDKVNVDIRSTHSGVIQKYFANEGDTVQVDANFFEIDTEAKGSAAPKQPAPAAAAPAKEAPAAPKKVSEDFNIYYKLGRESSSLKGSRGS